MESKKAAGNKTPAKHWLDAWHVNPSINRDYDFIDGLRGIAILMVLICHHIYVNPQAGPGVQFLGAFCEACSGGVILFFSLSGFLISWPFWKRKLAQTEPVTPPRYIFRRFWKIYPPLALSIILLTPVYILANGDWSYLPIAGKWLLGVPFIIPVSGRVNPVMWTLVVEVQFYLALPLVFFLLKAVPSRVCLWLVPLIFLVIPRAFRLYTGESANFYPNIDPHFPSALDTFGLGILVAGLDTFGMLKKSFAPVGFAGVLLWPVALLLIAWASVHGHGPKSPLENQYLWIEEVASACLLCFVADPKRPCLDVLCKPWLRWCGIISYEWYLFHQPILSWSRQFLGSAGGNPLRYAEIVGGALVASGILSAVVYRFYSLPILQWGRKG